MSHLAPPCRQQDKPTDQTFTLPSRPNGKAVERVIPQAQTGASVFDFPNDLTYVSEKHSHLIQEIAKLLSPHLPKREFSDEAVLEYCRTTLNEAVRFLKNASPAVPPLGPQSFQPSSHVACNCLAAMIPIRFFPPQGDQGSKFLLGLIRYIRERKTSQSVGRSQPGSLEQKNFADTRRVQVQNVARTLGRTIRTKPASDDALIKTESDAEKDAAQLQRVMYPSAMPSETRPHLGRDEGERVTGKRKRSQAAAKEQHFPVSADLPTVPSLPTTSWPRNNTRRRSITLGRETSPAEQSEEDDGSPTRELNGLRPDTED